MCPSRKASSSQDEEFATVPYNLSLETMRVSRSKLQCFGIFAGVMILATAATCQTASGSASTAWHNGRFHLDAEGVVSRSAIVLARPNTLPSEAMPLGNGRLGVSVWSANGLTAQLNRSDTFPHRLSLGQVSIPGLAALTRAPDYKGRLDLYNGEFVEQGGGITATAYVQPADDMLIVDVTGADPTQVQTVQLALWEPREPQAIVAGTTGILAETWTDEKEPGASGLRFGSLAGISAQGRNVSVSVKDRRTLSLSLLPQTNGHFRILIAGPHYNGAEQARRAILRALAHSGTESHKLWWHHYWERAGLIKITSADNVGPYTENLRNIYLYAAAAESGSRFPGSQAGVADLFSAVRDSHRWDPAAYWHWNLRMQVAANLGAGVPELNAPYFRLYRESLPALLHWTKSHMGGRPGICVPETMRFNGAGIEFESQPGDATPTVGLNCDAGSKPYYNARTLSTGAEVSLWIWQQYLQTRDRDFLMQNYPVLREAARFLLAYEQRGGDGLLHTMPSNAHEQEWDTTDPTTDLAARRTLYAETIAAATLLHVDPGLIVELRASLQVVPEFPRTEETNPATLLTTAADAQGNDVIAASSLPSAKQHNFENIGLEPVWPYGLIPDNPSSMQLARRTYLHRPYPTNQDWSFDPIQAARLGLGSEVAKTLTRLTETYQAFPNGFANWGGGSGEFYIEQAAVTATALQEALVQDFDGVIRIASAIPPGWDFDGTVFVRGRSKVDVQVREGIVRTAVIEAGTTQRIVLKNPWPGQPVDITDSPSGVKLVQRVADAQIEFPAKAGRSYIISRSDQTHGEPFGVITGTLPYTAKRLGARRIGLEPQSSR